jgi:general secretion pathway protein N
MSETHSPRRRLGTLLLLLLCCGLSGAVYVGLTEPITPAGIAAPPPPHSPLLIDRGPGFSMPPLSAYADVVARPLFSSTRRPAAQAALDDKPADFTLVGIVISPGERHALLRHGSPAQLEHVVEGQSVDGWTVTSIEPGRVLLAQSGREAEINSSTKPGQAAEPKPDYAPGTAPIANGGD